MIIVPTNASKKAPVVISAVQFNSNPTAQPGDLILWMGSANQYEGGLPTGYTRITSGGGGNGYQCQIGYKIATSSSETISGQWVDTYYTITFSGGASIGAWSFVGGQPATISTPPLSLQDTSGSSAVILWLCGQAYTTTDAQYTNIRTVYQQSLWKLNNTTVNPYSTYITTTYSNIFGVEIKNKL